MDAILKAKRFIATRIAPAPPPSGQALRYVSPHNGAPSSFVTGGAGGAGDRRRMLTRMKIVIGGGDVSQLVLSFLTWYMNWGSTATSAFTIEAAYLERESTGETRQILFGGSGTNFVPANATDVLCDAILPTLFTGAPAVFAVGTVWYARVQILLANVADTVPTSMFNANAWQCNPATTVLSAASAGGNLAILSGADYAPTPNLCMLALGRYVTGNPVVTLLIGDSIAQGVDDPMTGEANGLKRAQFDVDTIGHPRGGMMTALSGSTAGLWGDMTNSANLNLSLFKYATMLVDQYGINGGTVAQSVAVWTAARARGITKIVRTLLTPRTTGDMTSEAGQSYAAARPAINAFNTELATTAGIDVLVRMDSVRGIDRDKWAPNMTGDGLHPNAAGTLLMAAELRAVYAATAPPPPAPPPAPVGLMRTASVGGNFSEIGQGGHIPWLVNLVQEGVNGWKDGVNRQLIPGAPEWPTSDFIVTPKNVVTGAGGAVAYGRFVGFADSIANGDSNVYHGVSNVVYDAVSNVTTFNVVFPANITSLNAYWNLLFLGTRRTGGASGTINTGVTELQIATPGYTIADIASKIITDEAKLYAQSYKCLRFMDSSWTIGNLTADFLPNLRATQHLGYTWDDLIDVCNKSGCDMWWNVPAAYTDAAVTALFQYIDAKLDPALHCYWEYVNETWNSGQIDAHWQLGEVLTETKGFAGAYHGKKGTSIQRVQRAGNVLTFTTDHADLPAFGYVVGGGVFLSMSGFDVAARTAVVAVNGSTFGVSETGADSILYSVVMPGHNVRSFTRTAGVCTLTEDVDLLATWGWVVGTVIQLYNFDGLTTGDQPYTLTGVAGMTCTFALAGADSTWMPFSDVHSGVFLTYDVVGTTLLGAGTSLEHNAWALVAHRCVRQLMKHSLLVRAAVGDAKMMTRFRPVWTDQMDGGDGRVALEYLGATFPAHPINYYLYGLAGAPYFMNSPAVSASATATISEIAADLAANCRAAPRKYFYEQRAITCLVYGLKNLWYEGGADTTAGNNFGYSVQSYNRNMAQLDPQMKPAVKSMLQDWFRFGGDLANWYHIGLIHPLTQYQYDEWGVTDNITNLTAPKIAAIREVQAEGVALDRNVISSVIGTPVNITWNFSVGLDGPAGWTIFQYRMSQKASWLITTEVAGVYSMVVDYAAANLDDSVTMLLNGVVVGPVQNLVLQAGRTTIDPNVLASFAPVQVNLNAGINAIEILLNSGKYGWTTPGLGSGTYYVLFNQLRFTRVS